MKAIKELRKHFGIEQCHIIEGLRAFTRRAVGRQSDAGPPDDRVVYRRLLQLGCVSAAEAVRLGGGWNYRHRVA
jgi:hypothetical protein